MNANIHQISIAHRDRSLTVAALVFLHLFSSLANSQIVHDGSLGPDKTVTGPNHVIPHTDGRTVGNNLFHSFRRFNVNTGESATFTGPQNIANILARVTGGERSNINGLLRTSGMPDANLVLINPAGVAFGPGAELDVAGSFAVTTADEIFHTDNTRFAAAPGPDDALLTTAAPAAFGFLAEHPAAISVTDTSLGLGDPDTMMTLGAGHALTLVGGPITIDGGTIRSAGGRVALVAVDSPGQVAITTVGGAPLVVSTNTRFAPLNILDGSLITESPGEGTILLKAGQVTVDHSTVDAASGHGNNAGQVVIDAQSLTLTGGGSISADALGGGNAGIVQVTLRDTLRIDGTGSLDDFTGIAARALQEEDANNLAGGGKVQVTADTVEIVAGGVVTTDTRNQGRGGNIEIIANRLVRIDGAGAPPGTGVSSRTSGGGSGGNVRVESPEGRVVVRRGGAITARSQGPGLAGDVLVTAKKKVTVASGGQINSEATGAGVNHSGDVRVMARDITIRGGRVTARAGPGATSIADEIVLHATRSLVLDHATVTAESTGLGGVIRLLAGQSLFVFDSDITAAAGRGGRLIQIDPVFTLLDGSTIDARSGGKPVKVILNTDYFFSNNSRILTNTGIDFPETDISGSLVPLNVALFDAQARLAESCEFLVGREGSTFILGGRGGVPLEPGAWTPPSLPVRE